MVHSPLLEVCPLIPQEERAAALQDASAIRAEAQHQLQAAQAASSAAEAAAAAVAEREAAAAAAVADAERQAQAAAAAQLRMEQEHAERRQRCVIFKRSSRETHVLVKHAYGALLFHACNIFVNMQTSVSLSVLQVQHGARQLCQEGGVAAGTAGSS